MSTHLLPAFQPQPIPTPPLVPSRNEEPQTANPTKYDANPGLCRALEQSNSNELERASRNSHERRRQRRGGLDKQQSGREDGPRAHAAEEHHGPEKGHVEEGDVVVYMRDLAGEDDDGREEHEGHEGGVV